MSRPRAELQTKLEEILGSRNVYYQPPDGKQIMYPCIIYSLSRVDIMRADDQAYQKYVCYYVTVMDKKPTSDIYDQILDEFPMSRLERTAVTDKINHWYMTIYW